MPTATDTTAAPADVSSAPAGPSLADSIGEFFGDYQGGESPESDASSAAGTTPAEPGADDVGTDGEAALATDAGATQAESDGTPPESPATSADDTDPFVDTTPATFYVNGQPVTSEDIRVFKEGGAVIRPESLPNVLSQLAERATLSERVRARDAEYQALSKVSEWTDAAGKTYTGPDAAIEMRIGNASLLAENQLLIGLLTDPAKLQAALTTEQVADGRGGVVERVIVSPAAIRELQREHTLQQREVANAIRDHFRGVISEASKPAVAPINFTQAAPALVADVAKAANLDASVLTAEDRAVLAEQLPFHVKDGLASVAWQNLAKRLMTERAEQRTQRQTLVTSTEKATKDAQARLAAAGRGVRLRPGQPAPAARPAAPVINQRQQNESDLYDAQEQAMARAIRSRA